MTPSTPVARRAATSGLILCAIQAYAHAAMTGAKQ